jgi:hypothetical protein
LVGNIRILRDSFGGLRYAIFKTNSPPLDSFGVGLASLSIGYPTMLHHSQPRSGGVKPGLLAGLALFFSILALYFSIFRDPMGPIYSVSRDPFGSGLGGYDFSNASEAYKSQLRIEVNRDIKAAMALEKRLGGKESKERLESTKIEREADFKLEKQGKNKDKTTQYKILFISSDEDGERRNRCVAMQLDEESGLWRRRYMSEFDVEKTDKKLASEMRDWERKNRPEPPINIEIKDPPIDK